MFGMSDYGRVYVYFVVVRVVRCEIVQDYRIARSNDFAFIVYAEQHSRRPRMRQQASALLFLINRIYYAIFSSLKIMKL